MIRDQSLHRRRPDQQGLEDPLRHAGLAEDLLDRERRLRHVGRMLEQHHVARAERREPGAKRLPEREVPRHHGQDHAQRLEANVALGRCAFDGLVGQQPLRILSDPAGRPRALFDLGLGLDDRLAHL